MKFLYFVGFIFHFVCAVAEIKTHLVTGLGSSTLISTNIIRHEMEGLLKKLKLSAWPKLVRCRVHSFLSVLLWQTCDVPFIARKGQDRAGNYSGKREINLWSNPFLSISSALQSPVRVIFLNIFSPKLHLLPSISKIVYILSISLYFSLVKIPIAQISKIVFKIWSTYGTEL